MLGQDEGRGRATEKNGKERQMRQMLDPIEKERKGTSEKRRAYLDVCALLTTGRLGIASSSRPRSKWRSRPRRSFRLRLMRQGSRL